jgi:hypothetical protein
MRLLGQKITDIINTLNSVNNKIKIIKLFLNFLQEV